MRDKAKQSPWAYLLWNWHQTLIGVGVLTAAVYAFGLLLHWIGVV